MVRRLWSAGLSVIASSVVLASVLAAPGLAATVPQEAGNGLKVSPVTTNVTIEPGKTKVVTVYVQNVTHATITLQAIVNDFTASGDESGTPALLLNNQYAPSHSLKRYVAPINPVTLKPGEQKTVNAVIAIPANASGGGYFGAVRFMPAASNGNNGNVTLSASVGSLVLVKVPGDIKEELRLLSLDVRHGDKGDPSTLFTSSKGLVAAARFRNSGDVQEQPFGKILLQRNGKTVATYEINNTTPRGNVLPDSTRRFTVGLDKVGAFGKYTLVGNFGYGTNGQLLSGKTDFYVVPVPAILAVLAIIILIILAVLVLPKLVRQYNRRVLQKAGR
jgi:hypothetical protein